VRSISELKIKLFAGGPDGPPSLYPQLVLDISSYFAP
jgi:hypothetical protein